MIEKLLIQYIIGAGLTCALSAPLFLELIALTTYMDGL